MYLLIGSAIVLASVFGGYILSGGHLFVLAQPFEFLIIGGAAIGGFVTANRKKRGIADYFQPTIASTSSSGAGGVMGGLTMGQPGAQDLPSSLPSFDVTLPALRQPNDGDEGDLNYGNWGLSADRANASRRELLIDGLPPERIEKVVGMAEHDPLVPEDRLSARNRRISIVLMARRGSTDRARQAQVRTVLFCVTTAATASLILPVALFNRRRRAVHDMLAGTLVIRRFPRSAVLTPE